MLAASVAAGLVASGLFAYVAYRLGARVVVTPEARAAFTFYRVWWYVAAAVTLLAPLRTLAYMADALPPWLYHASANLAVVLACIGLWALLCNLLYLYTGSTRAWGLVAVLYALLAAWFLGLLAWVGPPASIADDGWSVVAVPAGHAPTEVVLGSLVALLGPQFLAALAYLGLVFHAPGRTQRYRILLVGGSILLWFGSTILASLLALSGASGALVPRLAGILSALCAILAYDPPGWVQRRFGVRRAGEERPPRSAIAKAGLPPPPGRSEASQTRP